MGSGGNKPEMPSLLTRENGYFREFMKFLFLLFIGLILTYFIKQPYLGYCGMSPESVMEYSMAENLARGRGWMISIREIYPDDGPVIHSPVGERGILYAFLLSFFIGIGELQGLNLFISFMSAILYFYLIRRIMGEPVAWFSFLLFLFYPRLNLVTSYVWIHSLILFLVLLSGIVTVYFKRDYLQLLSGGVLGLIFWTTPWGFLSLLTFLPGLIIAERREKSGDKKEDKKGEEYGEKVGGGYKRVWFFVLGFLVVCIPMEIMILHHCKTLVPPGVSLFFRIASYKEYLLSSYGYSLPSVSNFIFSNFGFITGEVVKNILSLTSSVINGNNLLYLLPGMAGVFMVSKEVRRSFPKAYYPFLSFAVLNFAGNCLLWSNPDFIPGSVFSVVFLFPLFFWFMLKVEWKKFPLGFALSLLMLLISLNHYLPSNHRRVAFELSSRDLALQKGTLPIAVQWIYDNSPPHSLVAAIDPWEVYIKTGRASGVLPVNLSSEKLREFCEKFGYNYVLENGQGETSWAFYENLGARDIIWMEEKEQKLWEKRSLP